MTSKRKLINKAKLLVPIVRIGKGGITESMISEIKRQLKDKKLVKIKLLRSALTKDRKEIAKELASKTNSELIQLVGFVVVLHKKIAGL